VEAQTAGFKMGRGKRAKRRRKLGGKDMPKEQYGKWKKR